MIESIEDRKIKEVGRVIGEGIESAFERAENMLREMAVNMKRNYEEHKDEIDAIVEKHRLEREQLQASMPKILIGDIIREKSIHCSELYCYQVDSIERGDYISHTAHHAHHRNEIVAIYRFDGMDFKCIWEREDYMKLKNNHI